MPRKPKPDYAAQPSVAAILKLINQKRGATAAEIGKARGLMPHTVRAVISRLGSKAKVNITKTLRATKMNVQSTPTFFLNGKQIRGAFTIEEFEKEIGPYLKG